MKVGFLLGVLFAAGAVCDNAPSQYLRPEQSEERKKDLLEKLRQGLKLQLADARHEVRFDEPTCEPQWGSHWFKCTKSTFSLTKVFHDLSKVKFDLDVKYTVLRRADNDQRGGSIQLSTVRNSVDVESTTSGWNIGGQLNGGFWSPFTGNMAGLTVSGGYSTSTTKTKQKGISEGTVSYCEPGYSCWIEAWTIVITLKGSCTTSRKLFCSDEEIWSESSCPLSWPEKFECGQWKTFKTNACENRGKEEQCTVTTPLLESDGVTPFHFEAPFRLPILSMWDKPRIIGYRAGNYLLAHNDHGFVSYDATSSDQARYRDRSGNWHYYEPYPTLDDQVAKFVHPHPRIVRAGEWCYELDSKEWFCPDRQGDERYYTEAKGYYYAKPNAPQPTVEEMAQARARQRPPPSAPEEKAHGQGSGERQDEEKAKEWAAKNSEQGSRTHETAQDLKESERKPQGSTENNSKGAKERTGETGEDSAVQGLKANKDTAEEAGKDKEQGSEISKDAGQASGETGKNSGQSLEKTGEDTKGGQDEGKAEWDDENDEERGDEDDEEWGDEDDEDWGDEGDEGWVDYPSVALS
ncbi:hypothetical protein CDD83_3492 [Cordyceps sp. RAO-2017]|nr:hypothetical protein CDD83_3492 [Cordyceps sp. RAO-2017]